MKLFKILFENNKPVSALPVENAVPAINIGYLGSKALLLSLIIYGDNVADCFSVANEIIEGMREFL